MIRSESNVIDEMYRTVGVESKTYSPQQYAKEQGTYEEGCMWPQYFFDAYLKRNAREESNGSAIKNIPPLDVMKKWFIPLPPLSEQKRIVAKINDVFGALDERDRL